MIAFSGNVSSPFTETTKTNNEEHSSAMLSFSSNSTTTLILVIVLSIICAFLVCSCWIISFLCFKQKSDAKIAAAKEKNLQLNVVNRSQNQTKKVASVELSDIRDTLGSKRTSNSKLDGIDIILKDDHANNEDGEHSRSVSELFNIMYISNTQHDNPDEENSDINTSKPGETLYPNDKRDDEVNAAMAQYGDNGHGHGGSPNIHATAGGPGNGVGMIGSLDEIKYQHWSEKEVLIWLKENLLNNGLGEDDAKHFLKEFAKMKIIGGTLHALKNNSNIEFSTLRSEFSNKNQAIGIWMVVQSCIQNIGENIHVD